MGGSSLAAMSETQTVADADTDIPPHRYDATMAGEIEERWQQKWRADGTYRDNRRILIDNSAPGRYFDVASANGTQLQGLAGTHYTLGGKLSSYANWTTGTTTAKYQSKALK